MNRKEIKFAFILSILLLVPVGVLANPSAHISYLENGAYNYHFTLFNDSTETGYNIFYFGLDFLSEMKVSSITFPSAWDDIPNDEIHPYDSDYSTFIYWQSFSENEDITVPNFLEGFGFTSINKLESFNFFAYFTNPNGEYPYIYPPITVPEPTTLLLLGSGLVGLGYLRRKIS